MYQVKFWVDELEDAADPDCIICQFFGNKFRKIITVDAKNNNKLSKLGNKGLNSLKETSKLRKDNFDAFLDEKQIDQIYVDSMCRSRYIKNDLFRKKIHERKRKSISEATTMKTKTITNNENEPKMASNSTLTKETGSKSSVNNVKNTPLKLNTSKRMKCSELNQNFDYKNHCLFCAKLVDTKTLKRNPFHKVKDLSFGERICNLLDNLDVQTDEHCAMKLRFSTEHDLVALEARYHRKCNLALRNGARTFSDKTLGSKCTKKVNMTMDKIFKFVDESEDYKFTLDDFTNLLNKDDYLPSIPTIQKRLKIRFGDENCFQTSKIFCVYKKEDSKKIKTEPEEQNENEIAPAQAFLELVTNDQLENTDNTVL